jgi:hypothetical protein
LIVTAVAAVVLALGAGGVAHAVADGYSTTGDGLGARPDSMPVPLALAPTIARVCGMLAGYGVLVLMVFMSRWPVLERGVGSDRLARWHAAAGRVVLTLVLLHALAAVEGCALR